MKMQEFFWRHGMNTLAVEMHPQAQNVVCTDDLLIVELLDGRSIYVPLVCFSRLDQATASERNEWELLGNGDGIHWPQIDEDLSVRGLLVGTKAP